MKQKAHQNSQIQTPKEKKGLLAYICPCFNFTIFAQPKVTDLPSMNNTEQQSHGTLPDAQSNSRRLPQLIIDKELNKSEQHTTKSQHINQSKVDIKLKPELELIIDQSFQHELMQQQYQQYLNRHKQKAPKRYPVDLLPQNKLIVVGNAQGKMLCKMKSVMIEPSQSALKKQKEANKHQQKSSDPVIEKYWDKRYLLFDKFDQGIKLDRQSWFSVTPQAVAQHVANRLAGFDAVLDGFCGAGGDSIKLAMTCKLVYSNDIDDSKIKLLINNASVYGVDNIHPSSTDFFKINFKRNEVEAVYLSPPWGGPEYHMQQKMQPEDFQPNLADIIKKSISLSDNLGMLLPVNTDIEALAGALSQNIQSINLNFQSCSFLVQKIYFRGSFKFIAVWVGSRINGINLGDQLEYIYRLLADGQEKFRHRRVVKKIRQDEGMLKLLNYIFECQKMKTKTHFLFQKFVEFLISNQLITKQKLEKLESLEEDDVQRQSKGQTKRSKALAKSVLSKELQGASVLIQRGLNVSCVKGNNKEVEDKVEQQTVSYVSSISQSKIKGTVAQRQSVEQTEANGVRIQEIEQSNNSQKSER